MLTTLLLTLAGAILAAVVGTLWYSGRTPMGKLHMRSVGFDVLSPEEQKKKIEESLPLMKKLYSAQIALSLLSSFAVVFIVTMSVKNGVSFGMALGFVVMNWLCFSVPTIGSAILWGNCERAIALKKFASDSLSSLVTLILIAFMTSFFI